MEAMDACRPSQICDSTAGRSLPVDIPIIDSNGFSLNCGVWAVSGRSADFPRNPAGQIPFRYA